MIATDTTTMTDYSIRLAREERARRAKVEEQNRQDKKMGRIEREVENVEAAVRSLRATIDAESSRQRRDNDDASSLPHTT